MQSTHENLFQDTFYIAVLFYAFLDSFMLMYLGNEIRLASDGLLYSLYESNWLEQTELSKQILLIVVERLKKPQELRVGKLFYMNMESFNVVRQNEGCFLPFERFVTVIIFYRS